MNAIDNTLINCGLHLSSVSDPFYENFHLEGNTVDGEELLYILNGSGFDLGNEKARQIYLVNCDNFTVSDYCQEGQRNYPVINVISCKDASISNSGFYAGSHYQGISDPDRFESPLRFEYSKNVVVRNNTIYNGDHSMALYKCYDISIYNNWFEASNLTFTDEYGDNYYDNGERGNFWRALDINDTDMNGIGDEPVIISQGEGVDRYPLVPGVSLDYEVLVERATTGEDIPIRIHAENLNMDILDGLTFSYGNETTGFIQQVLDHDVEEQIVYLPVPKNSLDIIFFNIDSSDKLGKNLSVGPVPVEVFDNDAPDIDVLSSSSSIKAGENISVIMSVNDNIEVENVWSVLSGAVEGEFPLVHLGSLWRLDIVTDEGVLGNVSITIQATDTSGNHADLVLDEVSLVDGTSPSILADLTPNIVSTGGEIIFSVVCSDVNGISFVRVEYRQGESSDIIYLDHIFNSSSSPDSLPVSFDPSEYTGDWSCYSGSISVPVNDDTDMTYRFLIEDTRGNELSGPWMTVNVIDDILPVVQVDLGSGEAWNGEEFDMIFTATDNIGIIERWLSVCHDETELLNETGEGTIVFSVPVDLSGSIEIRAFGRDASGNRILYVSDPIPVNDGILPTCVIEGLLKGETGKVLRLELVPKDNVGISSVSWSIGGRSGTGNQVEFDTDEEGEYRLYVEVQDLSGNKGSFNWTINMEDPHDVDGNRVSSIFIILIVIIAAIFVMVVIIVMFIISRRKRKQVDNGEDPSGSDYGSIEE